MQGSRDNNGLTSALFPGQDCGENETDTRESIVLGSEGRVGFKLLPSITCLGRKRNFCWIDLELWYEECGRETRYSAVSSMAAPSILFHSLSSLQSVSEPSGDPRRVVPIVKRELKGVLCVSLGNEAHDELRVHSARVILNISKHTTFSF